MEETMSSGARTGMQGETRGSLAVGVDLERSRRPGVPRLRQPAPLPNALEPVERQHAEGTVLVQAGPHKTCPPVFGTSVPRRGVSGLARRLAFRYPDHVMRHWTLLLLADRIDLWEHRTRRLVRVAAPALAILAAGALVLAYARR